MAHMLLPPPRCNIKMSIDFDTRLKFWRRPIYSNRNYNRVFTRIRLTRSSSSSSSCCCCCVVQTTQTQTEEEEEELSSSSSKEELRCCQNGWSVRRLNPVDEEMRKVAYVQAQAFHLPLAIFDHFFFQFFQAEVLAALLYRLRNSPPDRYACLVAEPEPFNASIEEDIIGVVDVTVQREASVVQHCQGSREYIYVSGIAVLNNFRRQKVATALLKACEMISIQWGYEYLALRAYEDDYGARKLYTNAGYKLVSGDPPWMTTWIGRKRRILMIKRSDITPPALGTPLE